MAATLPMFPLGSVLVPTALLPLHVFEPRYRALVADVLDDGREFGVVLIDRGHEVGGHDVRSDLGTVARVLEAREFDDGRWALVAAGTQRLRVVEWLADDPYPQAVVERVVEPAPGPDAAAARDATVTVLRRVLALASELGLSASPATTELADDPVTASFNALALAPIGPLDRFRVLGIDDTTGRLHATATVLEELEEDLQAQLRMDDDRGGAS